jgi:hypothetical protein
MTEGLQGVSRSNLGTTLRQCFLVCEETFPVAVGHTLCSMLSRNSLTQAV